MQTKPIRARNPEETKRKLVEATVKLMVRQGFNATTVDQICAEAGVTKGSFFHYFDTKEAIGRAGLEWWGNFGDSLYAEAWSNPDLDPLDMVHRHIEIMVGFAEHEQTSLSCMVGMLTQEMSIANETLRGECRSHLNFWTDRVTHMLTEAKKKHPPVIDFDPASVAWFLNSLWQGSMLVGKTRENSDMVISNLRHGRAYVDSLFGISSPVPVPVSTRVSAPPSPRESKQVIGKTKA